MFDFAKSLKFRILGSVFLVFSLAVAMVLYGVWVYQRDKLVEQAIRNARRTGMVIDAGLRSSMVLNDRKASMEAIRKMLGLEEFMKINILNLEGRVIMSSDPNLIGRAVDRERYPECMICHKGREGHEKETVLMTDSRGRQFIRTVTPIRNEPACYGCHIKENRNAGLLMIDSSLDEVNQLIAELVWRILVIGIGVFVLGALVLHLIITRFYTRPLEELRRGFARVGRGDFNYWVDVRGEGELAEMADSFNIMSRAIGRYVNEVRDSRDEVERHYDIVETLCQTIEKKELKDAVVSLLNRIFGAETVSFAMPMEKKTGFFELVNVSGDDNRRYHFFYDLESGPLLPTNALTREELQGMLSGACSQPVIREDGRKLLIPVCEKKMKIGLISVLKPEGEVFSPMERKVIPVVSHHITISFANAQLYSLAVTDGLTGLYTKRYLRQKLAELVEECRDNKRELWVLFLDLDHFKQVNDQYGHPVGDQVLIRVAELVLINIRHGDVACRYGGEEFVVLLENAGRDEALAIGERIRQNVEKYIFTIGEIPAFSQTVSVGLAGFPSTCQTADQLLSSADEALYQAKKAGRNRVVVFNG